MNQFLALQDVSMHCADAAKAAVAAAAAASAADASRLYGAELFA